MQQGQRLPRGGSAQIGRTGDPPEWIARRKIGTDPADQGGVLHGTTRHDPGRQARPLSHRKGQQPRLRRRVNIRCAAPGMSRHHLSGDHGVGNALRDAPPTGPIGSRRILISAWLGHFRRTQKKGPRILPRLDWNSGMRPKAHSLGQSPHRHREGLATRRNSPDPTFQSGMAMPFFCPASRNLSITGSKALIFRGLQRNFARILSICQALLHKSSEGFIS